MSLKRKADCLEAGAKRVKVVDGKPLIKPKPANPRANLLGLPRELRNIIYDCALIEESQPIAVTTSLREPGLLSVCKQIREEAREMWFMDNRFFMVVVDCDATHFAMFRKFYDSVADRLKIPRQPTVFFGLSGTNKWKNLLEWASRICAGERLCPMPSRGDEVPWNTDESVAFAVLNVAYAFQRSKGPWKLCKKAIAAMRPMAGNVNRAWLKDDW